MMTILIKKHTVFLFLLVGLMLFDFSVLFNFQHTLQTIIALLFLTLLPGVLFLSLVKVPTESVWEKVLYTVGISIAFLFLSGSVANWIFPLTGIVRPLTLYPLLYIFNVFLLIMLALGYIWSKNTLHRFHVPKISINKFFTYTLLCIFPILGVFGPLSLNNNGSEFFTMVLFLAIALYIIVLTIFHAKNRPVVYPASLYLISLSLLLMTSLRGWYITGHDIQQDFYVFQLAKQHGFWDMNLYKDAYNACLSITILPTIFATFLKIPDYYIYKIIFQVLFSLAP